jgi:WD40-like Beta Propeller Repeat
MNKAYRSLAWLLVCAAFMALAATPAVAFRGHVFEKSFGRAGSGNGEFSKPSGMAVSETTGQVYVLDQGNGRVERFSSTGAYEAQFNGSETPAKAFVFVGSEARALTGGIAVDNSCYIKKLSGSACMTADPSNSDVYVTDSFDRVVDKFSPAGVYLGQLQEASGGAPFKFEGVLRIEPERGVSTEGVGVDASGTVWVYQEGQHVTGEVDSFTNGEPSTFVSARVLENVASFSTPGFAVDAEDNLYVQRKQPSFVSKFSSSGKALSAPFVAEESSGVAVDLSSGEVFLDNVSSVGAFSAGSSLQERFGSGDLTSGGGLSVNGANQTVYVADSAANVVDVFPPEPPSKPLVVGESVSNVTGNSATFEAEVNPRGAGTEYHFEYGSCVTLAACASSGYGESIPVPDGFAGGDFEVHSVSGYPQDLLAGTVYHFRVVAHNEKDAPGTFVAGEERVLTTQTAGVFALPDGRAWELVSPPDKHGALILPIIEAGVVQASVAGDAMTYLTDAPTEAEPQGYTNNVQVLSTRGQEGWGSRDIEPPHPVATGFSIGQGYEYRFFSEDLSFSVVQPFGTFDRSLSEEASEQTTFLRTDFAHGHVSDPCGSSCYRPLVTGAPGYANVPEGTVFGEEGQCPPNMVCGPEFRGGTPDLSHVVLTSHVALTSPPAKNAAKNGLYEWSAGAPLQPVSVLPPSEGGKAIAGTFGTTSTQVVVQARHAISNDGSRIVWSANDAQRLEHLYVRDTVKNETVRLDTGLTGTPAFQAANENVSEVFFTDNGDLYEYNVEHGELVRLTEGAEVLGTVLGASEDGSYVYFVAKGVLAQGAVHGACYGELSTASNTCNLYVRHSGATALVAVLSGADKQDWSSPLLRSTVRVSPDGHWLAFMSQRSLTGYDNLDAFSGKPDEEVYLFDAGSGRVVCASCDPTGSRPVGVEYVNLNDKLVGGDRVWDSKQWIAANIPGWTAYQVTGSLHQPRYLSDGGRLFFNSSDVLVPQDVNGAEDVYQYEPPGMGDCTASSVTFSVRSGGCVGLISSGSSAEESAFLDASENGGDVFFLTAARLASQDYDTALDVYDAHECTGVSPCFPAPAAVPPPCATGDSCKVAPSPQPVIFGAPSSATFSGAGNVTPSAMGPVVAQKGMSRAQKLARALRVCHRKRGKRARVVCERSVRARYAARGSSGANKSRKGRG